MGASRREGEPLTHGGRTREFDNLPCCGLGTAYTWRMHVRDSKPSPARGEENEAFLLMILCIRAVPDGKGENAALPGKPSPVRKKPPLPLSPAAEAGLQRL